MKNPYVSIIVPSFNHATFLKKRLDSILNQTYQNFEVILLDDSSTDGSQQILKSYKTHPRVSHLIFNKHNSGNTFSQWNKGIKLAKDEFIWIAESDDFCESEFLEAMIQPLLRDSEVAISFCQSHKVDYTDQVTGKWLENTSHFQNNIFQHDFLMDGNKFIENYLIHQNVIPNASAVLFRKNIALELGLPDTEIDYKYNGDWLFYLKMLVGNKVAFSKESLNYFRSHDTSVIAKARKRETIASIIERDDKMLKNFIKFLKYKEPENVQKILQKNIEISRNHQLKKALSLYRSKQFRRSLITFIPVLDLYFKNQQILKRMKKGLKRLLNEKGGLCFL